MKYSKRVQVKNLKVGDKIKTFDPKTKEHVFKTVTDKFISRVEKENQYLLEFENGAKLNCSNNHQIMVMTEDGVIEKMPKDLMGFDAVVSEGGITNLIRKTNGLNNDEDYLDITVSDIHTFFCSESENDEMILTHNSQGGVRGGAATLFYPFWHLEVESLLVLKNNRGTEDNRVRHLDYGVQFNKLMYKRLIEGGDITLFSPSDVPGLYDAFFEDQDKFEELYHKYEEDTYIRKKKVKAGELFSEFISERASTGRIYLQNVDHCNEHSPFDCTKAPIRQSNLCLTGDTKVHVMINDCDTMTISLDELNDAFPDARNIYILSKNLDSNEREWKEVTASALTKRNASLIKITDDETGKSIRCTPEHKVFTKNRGYVMAKDLREDDVLDSCLLPHY